MSSQSAKVILAAGVFDVILGLVFVALGGTWMMVGGTLRLAGLESRRGLPL